MAKSAANIILVGLVNVLTFDKTQAGSFGDEQLEWRPPGQAGSR
jgi:hypothetical protein